MEYQRSEYQLFISFVFKFWTWHVRFLFYLWKKKICGISCSMFFFFFCRWVAIYCTQRVWKTTQYIARLPHSLDLWSIFALVRVSLRHSLSARAAIWTRTRANIMHHKPRLMWNTRDVMRRFPHLLREILFHHKVSKFLAPKSARLLQSVIWFVSRKSCWKVMKNEFQNIYITSLIQNCTPPE